MAEYTPTTEQVREEYSITVIDGTVLPSRARAFDRWLAAYEAEVRERITQDIARAVGEGTASDIARGATR